MVIFMSWLTEKLRGLFVPDEEEKGEASGKRAEGMSLEEFYSVVESRLAKDSARKEEIKKEFAGRIERLEGELSEALKKLKEFDLTKRKENEKLKLVVEDNYNLYCTYVERLLKDVSDVKSLGLDEMIPKLSLVLVDFSKKAFEPYEKATILIGEAMAGTKKAIGEFIRDFEGKQKENKSFFAEAETIRKVNGMLAEIKKNEGYCREIDERTAKIRSEREKIEGNLKLKEAEIEAVRNSEEYKADLKLKEAKETEVKKLEWRFLEIKNKIDMKLLKKQAHFDEKKNRIVKSYGNNFRQALIEDEGLEIVKLAMSAQNLDIGDLREIRAKFIEMKSPFLTESDKKIFDLETGMRKMADESGSMGSKIEEEAKRKEKLIEKRAGITAEIREAGKSVFGDVVLN